MEGLSKFDGEAGQNVLQGSEQAMEINGGLLQRANGGVGGEQTVLQQEQRLEER